MQTLRKSEHISLLTLGQQSWMPSVSGHVTDFAKHLTHIGLIGELNETQLNDVKLRIERALDLHSLLDFEGYPKINSNQMGNSLIQEPFIHDALLTIGLIREQQSGEDLCRLIHSPFWLMRKTTANTRAELERVIRKRLTNLCRVSDFLYFTGETQKDHYCPQFYRALGKYGNYIADTRRRLPQSNWMQLFVDILQTLAGPAQL